jgi:ketosteroid isomerase-like protein
MSLSCYQIGTLQDGKIVSYGDYEDMQATETVCHECLEPVEVAE